MKILKVFAENLEGNRSAVLLDLNCTPYAIVTNLDVTKREGEQWDSAYNYYSNSNFIGFIKDVIELCKSEKENDLSICRIKVQSNGNQNLCYLKQNKINVERMNEL